MTPTWKIILAGVVSLATLAMAPLSRAAVLIRDAEIERTLRFVARPILQKAGLPVSSIRIFIINDRSMNAFVVGGNNIFINTGLISRLKNVEMLQAVIAHEVGHITGGHLAQRAVGVGNAKTAVGLGILLGIAATAAGSGNAGIVIAGSAAQASQRSLLAFTRSQEASADQSGARFMAAAGINPQAAVDVLNIFRGQEALSVGRRDPYAVTHPLSTQRITNLKSYVAAFRNQPSLQVPGVDYWYARMRVKFGAFIGNPTQSLRRLQKSDKSELAVLTRAIAYHRLPDLKKALSNINALTRMRPKDAYYQELKGQILLESGKAPAAVSAYQSAVKLAPKEPLILAGLGRALLATNTRSNNKRALSTLRQARTRDPHDGRMLRDLAMAYARAGQNGMASLVTAERYALSADFKQAALHARRAEGLLPAGTSGWLRAQDILGAAKRADR
jgi:predicted Zn-dependent protease